MALSNSHSIEKQAVLTALTINIARFTQWPDHVFKNDFEMINLCVVGDNVVQEAFSRLEGEVVNGRVLRVLNRSRFRHLSECHILYLSEVENNILLQILLEIQTLAVLTIGENIEFIQSGGMVSFEKNKGKIQLNVNLSSIKQTELAMSSRILKLAKIFKYPIPTN